MRIPPAKPNRSLFPFRRLRVEFEADVVLIGDEIPETLDDRDLRQAVQNVVGSSGVAVASIQDWQEENR